MPTFEWKFPTFRYDQTVMNVSAGSTVTMNSTYSQITTYNSSRYGVNFKSVVYTKKYSMSGTVSSIDIPIQYSGGAYFYLYVSVYCNDRVVWQSPEMSIDRSTTISLRPNVSVSGEVFIAMKFWIPVARNSYTITVNMPKVTTSVTPSETGKDPSFELFVTPKDIYVPGDLYNISVRKSGKTWYIDLYTDGRSNFTIALENIVANYVPNSVTELTFRAWLDRTIVDQDLNFIRSIVVPFELWKNATYDELGGYKSVCWCGSDCEPNGGSSLDARLYFKNPKGFKISEHPAKLLKELKLTIYCEGYRRTALTITVPFYTVIVEPVRITERDSNYQITYQFCNVSGEQFYLPVEVYDEATGDTLYTDVITVETRDFEKTFSADRRIRIRAVGYDYVIPTSQGHYYYYMWGNPNAEAPPEQLVNFEIISINAPSQAKVGETFEVTVTVKNAGQIEGTKSIDLFVNGNRLYQAKPITLKPNETGELKWTLSCGNPATLKICADFV